MSAVDAARVVELSTWSSGRESHIKAYYKFVCIFWKYVHSVGGSDGGSRSKYTNVYVYINWINAFRFPWFIITYYINFYLAAHTLTLTFVYSFQFDRNAKEQKEEREGEDRTESAMVYVCLCACAWKRHDWHRRIKNLKKNVNVRVCVRVRVHLKSTQQLFPSPCMRAAILNDMVRIVRVCTLNLDGNQVENRKRPAKMYKKIKWSEFHHL